MRVPATDTLTGRVQSDIESMREVIKLAPHPELYGPRGFWEGLSEKHIRLIKEFGFEQFKRTINFEYNQWGVRSFRDKKIRNLLIRLLLRGRVPLDVFSLRLNREQWADLRWSDDIAADTGHTLKQGPSDQNAWKQRAY